MMNPYLNLSINRRLSLKITTIKSYLHFKKIKVEIKKGFTILKFVARKRKLEENGK